jgi:hypothetical protein
MNTVLQQKLNAYAMAAGCFLSFTKEAAGQVIYTDIEPDLVVDHALFAAEIDMDNNGVQDFFFHNNSFIYYDTSWLSFRTMKNIILGPDEIGNAFAGISNSFSTGYAEFTRYYPFALNNGSLIDELKTWQGTETQIMALRVYSDEGAVVGSGGYCYWFNFAIPETVDKYLGVRFKDSDGDSHYGWIRCDVLELGTVLVIKDYAYEVEPSYPIVAGDTAHFVGINAYDNTLACNVYSFRNKVYVSLEEGNNCRITIFDLQGKQAYTDILNGKQNCIELQVPSGIYMIEVEANTSVFAKQLFIACH